jgi:hypothetical protein
MPISMLELIQNAKDNIEIRNTIFNTDPNSYPDRMAGYILALYEIGIISFNERENYAQRFSLDIDNVEKIY